MGEGDEFGDAVGRYAAVIVLFYAACRRLLANLGFGVIGIRRLGA